VGPLLAYILHCINRLRTTYEPVVRRTKLSQSNGLHQPVYPVHQLERMRQARFNVVGPGYFRTLGIPLIVGRGMLLTLTGGVLGLAAALALTRVMASLL